MSVAVVPKVVFPDGARFATGGGEGRSSGVALSSLRVLEAGTFSSGVAEPSKDSGWTRGGVLSAGTYASDVEELAPLRTCVVCSAELTAPASVWGFSARRACGWTWTGAGFGGTGLGCC